MCVEWKCVCLVTFSKGLYILQNFMKKQSHFHRKSGENMDFQIETNVSAFSSFFHKLQTVAIFVSLASLCSH